MWNLWLLPWTTTHKTNRKHLRQHREGIETAEGLRFPHLSEVSHKHLPSRSNFDHFFQQFPTSAPAPESTSNQKKKIWWSSSSWKINLSARNLCQEFKKPDLSSAKQKKIQNRHPLFSPKLVVTEFQPRSARNHGAVPAGAHVLTSGEIKKGQTSQSANWEKKHPEELCSWAQTMERLLNCSVGEIWMQCIFANSFF